MLTEDEKRLVHELGRTAHGKALQRMLEERLAEMNDVSTVSTWDETMGRKYAVKLIRDIFNMFEKREQPEKSKNQYL